MEKMSIRIITSARECQYIKRKVIIYGGGGYGTQLYEKIYGYIKPEDIYVCDKDDRICENFPQFIYLKNLKDFVLQYQEVCFMIAVKDKDVVCDIHRILISMGINEKDIYQYVPELKEAWVSRKIKEGFFNGNQAVHVMQDRKAKKYIESLIKGKEPFLCARWGAIEGKIVYRNKIGILREQDKEEGCNNAGIFPITDEVIAEYIKITEKAAKKIDVLCMGVWVPQLEELYRIYSPKAVPVSSMVLEICQDSVMLWTKALERMRVLVIHPFSALIRQQYKKRKYLFSKLGEDILPEMELITYQAVQSIGGTTEYMSWVSALEKMEKDISKIEFDIALIGCGSYGLPLGAYIKEKLNKKAIHVGGVLQLFFGIKGKRWDERGYDTWLYNEHWVRPTKDLRPLNYKNVENGCYW